MRGWLMTIVLLAAAAPRARGQDAAGEQQSLLEIFWAGIEIPTYFIVAGSFVVIALIIEHFINIRRVTIVPPEQVDRARRQIEARDFRRCLDKLRQSHTFFARVMSAALPHARHGFEAMHDAALEKSGELSGQMFRKAEYLNIIGNLGPLLGLLGTVWGMIEAFGALGAAGGSGGELASGISKALVNTLAGLALAILGIGFYGVCRNRIDSLTVAATVETLNLLEYFRPAPAARAPAEAAPRSRAASTQTPTRPAASPPPERSGGAPQASPAPE